MLDALILDTIERIYANRGYLPARPRWHLMHSGATGAAASKLYSPPGSARIYNEVLDLFFWQSGEVGSPLIRFSPELWFAGQPAVVQDTALSVHQLAVELATGRMWGVVNSGSGADGLYRRDASASTPNWTKVIGSVNAANLYIHRKVNGDLWFNDATAGNWYLLTNGSASSAQTTAPSGLSPLNGWSESCGNVDCVRGFDLASWAGAGGNYASLLSTSFDSLAAPWSAPQMLFDNASVPSVGALRGVLPSELVMGARFQNQLGIGNAPVQRFRLDSTYTLFALVNLIQGSFVGDGGASSPKRYFGDGQALARVSLALLNKDTWSSKWLGCLPVPFINEGGGDGYNQIAYAPTMAGARLKSHQLDIVMNGIIGYDLPSTTAKYGLMLAQLPLEKLDI